MFKQKKSRHFSTLYNISIAFIELNQSTLPQARMTGVVTSRHIILGSLHVPGIVCLLALSDYYEKLMRAT